MEIRIIRRSLATQLRDAAAAQGKRIETSPDPTPHGRLGYRINDGEWLTPGDTAIALGVSWP